MYVAYVVFIFKNVCQSTMVGIPVMLHVLRSRVCFKPVLTFNAKTLNLTIRNIRKVEKLIINSVKYRGET